MTLEPGLYVTATPIGNLGDMSRRAIETMKAVDLILCEDTRHTARLCQVYGVETPRAAYHDHNAAEVGPGLLDRLVDGARMCLVSDAGTPLISDPGYRLVRAARDAGVAVFTVPGPSAALAALSISGAPTDRFYFAGFPPSAEAARLGFLKKLAPIDATLIFYESPNRLAESLATMTSVFGDRRAVVARELTKIHEEAIEGSLGDLSRRYAAAAPKGEIVIVVHPPPEPSANAADLDTFLEAALGQMSVRDAAAAAADAIGAPKRMAYERALAIGAARLTGKSDAGGGSA